MLLCMPDKETLTVFPEQDTSCDNIPKVFCSIYSPFPSFVCLFVWNFCVVVVVFVLGLFVCWVLFLYIGGCAVVKFQLHAFE